jgi:hypothetical protein
MEEIMDVITYNFPMLKDGRIAVEEKFCELYNQYRNGDKLDPEALDWMDTANNWLMTVGSKL